MPLVLAQHPRRLVDCAPASAAIGASKSHRPQRNPAGVPLLRPCHWNARQMQSALQHHLEVVVGLAAAPVVETAAAHLDSMPSQARRARPRRCETHRSVCRCKKVQWSCLCSAVEMCFGVCIVGVHARVLARACVRVPRTCCRASLPAPETAPPFSSSTAAGPLRERRGHPPWGAVHRKLCTTSRRSLTYSSKS